MPRLFFVSVLLFLVSQPLAAQMYSGKLVNVETGEPVAFAHIYRVDGEGGTTSGRDGKFSYSNEDELPFELMITAVGYEDRRIASEDFPNSGIADILLTPVVYESDEAVVIAANLESYRLRNRRSWLGRSSKSIDSPPSEHVAFGIAQSVTLEKTPAWPVTFRFPVNVTKGKYSEQEIDPHSQHNSTFTFRIRFTETGPDGMPTDIDLAPAAVVQAVPAERGWVEFDLSSHPASFKQETFFILIEWLVDDTGRQPLLPVFEIRWNKGGHYYRFNPNDKWRESPHNFIFDFRYEG